MSCERCGFGSSILRVVPGVSRDIRLCEACNLALQAPPIAAKSSCPTGSEVDNCTDVGLLEAWLKIAEIAGALYEDVGHNRYSNAKVHIEKRIAYLKSVQAQVKKELSLYEQANNAVRGIKRQEYGPLQQSFECLAKAWSSILKRDVTPRQVCLCMASLKLVRESEAHKDDNVLDFYGYTICYEELLRSQSVPETNQPSKACGPEVPHKERDKCCEST